MAIVNERFREGQQFQNPEAVPINVDKMVLNFDYDVRAYFIHEGAGYKNTVGVRVGNKHQLLFPDASYDGAGGVRLKRGDFVKLGTVKKGTKFDLMVIPNGGNGGLGGRYYRLYSTPSLSDDKRQHFVGFWIEDTPLLMFGAEDLLGGGDNDFEDVVIVMDFGLDYDPKQYFVSTRGNDRNDGRSLGKAFRTINKAASLVKPGDTVYVQGGTYKETIRLRQPGTDLHPIKFVARGNVTVLPPAKNNWTVLSYYADHTVFEGFRFSGENVTYGNGWAYGFYNYHSDVTFKNCEFDKMLYGLYGVYSGLAVDNCNFHDNYGYSVVSHYGGLLIDDSKFNKNNHGPYSYRDHKFAMTDSQVTDNKGWALLYSFKPYGTHKPFGEGKPTVKNCSIKDNANGLYLVYAEDDDKIKFERTKFENTKSWEMELVYCDLTVTPRWREQFPIEKGGSGLYTYASKLKVKDMKFEDYESGWGFLDYYSDLQMQGVSVRKNYHGMQTYAPVKFAAKNCKFDDNKYWGFLLYNHREGAEAELSGCSMSGNAYGAYLYRTNKDNLELRDTTIADNTTYGVYLRDCVSSFTPRTLGTRWKLKNNGYNITTWGGKVEFDDVTLSDAKYYAVLAYYSDVRVRNSNFTNSGHGGFYAYYNKSFNALNSKFDQNRYYGMVYASNGKYYGYDTGKKKWGWWDADGPGRIANCSIQNNKSYGLYLSGAKQDTFRISNTPIRGNGSAGIYAVHSDLVFNPQTMRDSWKLSDNGSHIYAYYGKYRFEGLNFNDAKSYGIATGYSDVEVKDCSFKGNGYTGFQSYYNKSFVAKDSKFDDNKNWGATVYHNGRYYGIKNGKWGWQDDAKPAVLKDCSFEKNRHGLYLSGATDRLIRLDNTPINDNQYHGLYAVHCDLSFTPKTVGDRWQIKGNGYGITAYYGNTLFEEVDVTDSKYWGALTYYGNVKVHNSTFKGNGHGGLQSYYNKSFAAEDSTFTDNGHWGVSYYSNGKYYGYNADQKKWGWWPTNQPGQFARCSIDKNRNHGLYLGGVKDDALQMVNTTINDNPYHGLYAVNCELDFTPDTMGSKWQIKGNGYGITTYYGKILFDDVEVSDNKYWGALTRYGDITIKDSTFTRNPHGGLQSYYNKSFKAKNSNFDENGSWGLTYYSNGKYYGYNADEKKWGWWDGAEPGELKYCSISNNKSHGMYLYGVKDTTLNLEGTQVANNRYHGLYLNNCDLSFTNQNMGKKWLVKGNGYGITSYYGKTLFDGAEVSDNKYWGVLTRYGDVKVKNSSFLRNGHGGLQSYYDKSFVAENSKFNEQKAGWGFGYISDGRYYGYKDGAWGWHEGAEPAKISDCEFSNNKGHGMYVQNVKDNNIQLTDSVASGNGSIGIAFYNSTVTLSPDTSGKWVSKNNGHGFHANSSNITISDFEITGNKSWGMYTYYSNVNLKNAKFSGNGHNMYWYAAPWAHGFNHKLTVEDSIFENSTGHHGLLTYYGLVDIKNSKFRNNKGDGLYTVYNKSVAVDGAEFTGNKRWGAVFHVNYPQTSTWGHKELFKNNVQTLSNAKVDGNYQGVYVYNAADANFDLKKTDITNNRYYSLYYNRCNLLVDDQQTDEWTLDGNGYGPAVVYGDVTFKNVVNKNSKHYGFLGWYGKMTLDGVTSSGSRYGFYQYKPSAATTIKDSRFDGRNDEWGWGLLSYGGGVDATNNIFSNFYNGAYTYTYGNESQTPIHNVYNNTFANLRYWGAYLPNGSATVRNNIFSHRTQDTGGYGIAHNGGSLTHSHNLVHGFAAPFYRTSDPDETTVLNKPRFVNSATGDFHLKKGSPAINSGAEVAMVPYDMEGNRRPAYEVFEIGAYEYTAKDGSFRVLDWQEKK